MTTSADNGSSRPTPNGPTSLGIAPALESNWGIAESGSLSDTPENNPATGVGSPAPRGHKKANNAGLAARTVHRGKRAADARHQDTGDPRRTLPIQGLDAGVQRQRTDAKYAAYRAALTEAAVTYGEMSPLSRLRLANPFTIVSHALVALGFVVWWQLMPKIRVVEITVAGAYALEPKPILHMAVFAGLLTTFVVTLWMSYFSRTSTADRAGTLSKVLLAFFAGPATHFLAMQG